MGPDLHLIKQVEQGQGWFWKDRPGASPRSRAWDRRLGVVFLFGQLLNWRLFGCKNSQEMAKDDLRSTRPGMLPAHPAVS
jgi:hypothetical protein